MKDQLALAIETSCRVGSVALGRGPTLVRSMTFDAVGRHATQLISRLRSLLQEAGLRPQELDEAYVSAGPGSFTGLRVGVTAVRTLAQALGGLRCVAVPTALVVADNARDLPWEHLGVIMDAREGSVHATVFARHGEQIVIATPGRTLSAEDFLAGAPRPILLVGEGLAYQDLHGEGITVLEPARDDVHLPSAEGVWRVGRRLAAEDNYTDYTRLLPIYARKPEAVRLLETGPAST